MQTIAEPPKGNNREPNRPSAKRPRHTLADDVEDLFEVARGGIVTVGHAIVAVIVAVSNATTKVIDLLPDAIDWLKRRNWRLIGLKTVSLVMLLPLYFHFVSTGFQAIFPDIAEPLHKAPFFGALKHYAGWHDLDWSHMLALVLMGGVWWATSSAMKILLYGAPATANPFAVNFIMTAACVLLTYDAFVFYHGISGMGFFREGVLFTNLLSTVGYAFVIAVVSFLHATLSQKEIS